MRKARLLRTEDALGLTGLSRFYDHSRMLASHGIIRCTECDGEGYTNQSKHWDGEYLVDCERCNATGWTTESFRMNWRRV